MRNIRVFAASIHTGMKRIKPLSIFCLVLAVIAFAPGNISFGVPATSAPIELVLQTPPAGAVNSIAVSPDGTLVAAAANEGGIRIHDAKTGKLLRVIGGAGDRSIAFTPDGQRLAAGGFHMDKLIGLFDVHNGERLQTFAGHEEWEVDACTISPDGKMLASSGVDKQILVWDLATGMIRHRITGQPQRASALAFSPDSATLASGSNKTVKLWDMKSGELRRTLAGYSDWVCALRFSPDGKSIASGSCDWSFHRGHDWPYAEDRAPEVSEWRLWDSATGHLHRTVKETGRLLSLDFAPDGKSLACALGTEARVYDLSSDTDHRVVTRHHFGVTSVAFTPDGTAMISGSHDHSVKRTSLANSKEEWLAPGYLDQVNSIALSKDGSLLATGSGDSRFALGTQKAGAKGIGTGAVRLWDANTGRLLRRLGDPTEQVMAVAVAPDGQFVAAGGGSPDGKGVVRLWDAAKGVQVGAAEKHLREVLAVAFSPDGSLLASGSADGVIKLRDSKTGTLKHAMSGHGRGATSLVFSTDGAMLACGGGDGTTLLWEVRTGKRIGTYRPADSQAATIKGDRPITSIALSRDGETLVTCTAGVLQTFAEPVRLWDIRTGKLKRQFSEPAMSGRPMAVSPDGKVIATGGKSVRLWDAETGKPLRELFGHLKRTQSIAFTSDGRRLFSGGSYGTTNAWEVASGRHLATLFAFPKEQSSAAEDEWLAYHPDGYYDGSSGVDRFLAWRVGDDLLTPAALASQLRSPHRIESALGLQPADSGTP